MEGVRVTRDSQGRWVVQGETEPYFTFIDMTPGLLAVLAGRLMWAANEIDYMQQQEGQADQ